MMNRFRHPRRARLLCQMFDYSPSTLHVIAHRTAVGAAMIAETAEGVSYPATIRPLVGAGLIEVGELIAMQWATTDWATSTPAYRDHLEAHITAAYHSTGRPITLTDAGREFAASLTGMTF